MASIQITTAPFQRTHGRAPRRNDEGLWALQRTRTEVAFDADLEGEIVWYSGKPGEIRRFLESEGHTGLWAVLG